MIKVEKYIPIPGPGRQSKYPWSDLKPGDSFFVPTTETDHYRRKNSLNGTAYYIEGARNWDLTVRNAPGGLRVWRVR